MLFKRITFDNYKTYYGTQKVDLYIPPEVKEKEGKNIILIGGLNGAGKTTILKAIKDVLYGKREISDEEYKRTFSNVINNTFYEEGGRECSVSLVLETDAGDEWELKVKWYFNAYKVMTHDEREVTVKTSGAYVPKKSLVGNIEQYNRMIDKIMPYYASPFFIFDGEEVKEIIIRQEQNEMKEAIHKITGMNSYKQLIKDLSTLKSDIEAKVVKAQKGSQTTTLKKQYEEIESSLNELEAKAKEIREKIKGYEEKLILLKNKRNKILSQNSRSREEIIKRQAQISTHIEQHKKNLDQLLKENMTLIILKSEINKLKEQLKVENRLREAKLMKQASLKPYHQFMDSLLNIPISPALTQQQIEQIHKIGEDIWINQNDIKFSAQNDSVELHDVSTKDFQTIMNISSRNEHDISTLINNIEKLEQEFEATETELRNAPEFKDTAEENNKIEQITKIVGQLTLQLKSVNNKVQIERDLRSTLMNKLTRSSDSNGNLNELTKQLEQTNSVLTALNRYIAEVTTLKANFIREEFTKMLVKLFRKQDEFGKIEFDINTFTVRLFNDKMQEISIKDRSAGEMQMISSALIWALIKVSDLDLPVVIDTPLGRLDSHHRNQLINHYYNELSNQVVILSTDTEITQDYVDVMKKHSYKQYMLDYNESKKYTLIRDGYFEFIGS
ncbi:DNA sulfur modification protein DndD [Planococcus maritimus]|uniref:DNA sulfur modification protein DndD n=1 Tax=Planococcus maritimus TaxID=192421 RepID=UPI00084C6D90|nr:DNA sulfur modification protein DndD [Planococcus maritimus]OED33573.1 DNA sulfur modification protein DndD [Planococcus maritimus]